MRRTWPLAAALLSILAFVPRAQATYGTCFILAYSPGIACSVLEGGTATFTIYPSPDACARLNERSCRGERDGFYAAHRRSLAACGIREVSGVLYEAHCVDQLPPGVTVPRTQPVVDPSPALDPSRWNYDPPPPARRAPSFDEVMRWVRDHQGEIGGYAMLLIVGALLAYFGGNAIAAFFSGGWSLTTAPATGVLLAAVIVGILRDHGHAPGDWDGPRASVEAEVDEAAGTVAVRLADPAFESRRTVAETKAVLEAVAAARAASAAPIVDAD